MDKDEFIIVGRLGAPYGVKGWVKLQSFTQAIQDIMDYSPWYLKQPQGWVAVTVTDVRPHGKGLVARLPDCHDRDKAQAYTNIEIAIKSEQLAELPADEYYWTDLTGLRVIDQDNQELGTIDHLFETGANDVIVIKGKHGEILIPFLMDDVIKKIDLDAGVMHVDWHKPEANKKDSSR